MNKYLVALSVGGLMEMPEITYQQPEVITAKTPQEAADAYNKKNKCTFFYGTTIAENCNGKITVFNKKASYEWVEMLRN